MKTKQHIPKPREREGIYLFGSFFLKKKKNEFKFYTNLRDCIKKFRTNVWSEVLKTRLGKVFQRSG